MNLNFRVGAIASAMALTLCSSAFSSVVIFGAVGGSPPSGQNYVTFDALSLGGAGGIAMNTAGSLVPLGSIAVSFNPDAQVVNGAASGLYAPPVLSNNNGLNFNSQANGVDTTNYITSGKDFSPNVGAKATLTFSAQQQYFGLLWGSVDLYNTLEFFNGATSVGVITGGMVNANANGNQGAGGTFYVNINSTLGFDRVVATSSNYAFEFDNVAYGLSQIPEPGSIAIWSAFAGLGLIFSGRRSRKS